MLAVLTACAALALSAGRSQARASELGYTGNDLLQGPPRVLFFTHSAGFVHDVVKRPAPDVLAPAEQIFTDLVGKRFRVRCSQDVADLAAEQLERFDALVFMTTGELPLSRTDCEGLLTWVASGGAFAGIHCAADTLHEFAPYLDMVGGAFESHPWHEEIIVRVEDDAHPAALGLPPSFTLTDEVYQFTRFRRHPVRVLLTLDPASVEVELGTRADADYALAWTRDWGQGRVFYTALGHGEETWRDARFQSHLLKGITWTIDGPDRPAPAPHGARVLFSASVVRAYTPPRADARDLSSWSHGDGEEPAWRLVGDALEVVAGAGDLVTKDAFGDGLYHVEFRTPSMPEATGQARGNSGVYLQGRYEVQVLDSHGLEPGLGDCGAIYGKRVAAVNASRAPERWQSFDIEFRAPRFDSIGGKNANARLTVWHNGLRIHDDVELDGPTAGGSEEAPLGPLVLQDHGNPVRYRNVWVLPR